MRDDYKIKGATAKLEVDVEDWIVTELKTMAGHCGHNESELTNTALRQFLSRHKDFLPPLRGGRDGEG